MTTELLTTTEVADLIGIPPTTVRHHCRVRTGLLYNIAVIRGGRYLIPALAVEPFDKALRTRRGEST